MIPAWLPALTYKHHGQRMVTDESEDSNAAVQCPCSYQQQPGFDLNRWSGLMRLANLYLPCAHAHEGGLDMPCLLDHYKWLQVSH